MCQFVNKCTPALYPATAPTTGYDLSEWDSLIDLFPFLPTLTQRPRPLFAVHTTWAKRWMRDSVKRNDAEYTLNTYFLFLSIHTFAQCCEYLHALQLISLYFHRWRSRRHPARRQAQQPDAVAGDDARHTAVLHRERDRHTSGSSSFNLIPTSPIDHLPSFMGCRTLILPLPIPSWSCLVDIVKMLW